MSDRILQSVAADGPLQSLTATELQLDSTPMTIDPKPRRRVRAWVRFGQTPVQVDGLATRWTDRAVGVEFHVAGESHRCWVWASAVEEVEG